MSDPDRRPPLHFRPPKSSPYSQSKTTFAAPGTDFLSGSWYVTHSTLPMWKLKRNVVITYTPLESSPGSIDDLVEYMSVKVNKWKTIRGIDKPDPAYPAAYSWRGKGWLMIASSYWEVLAYGDEEGGWAVTFFEKTLFTPAGVDFYARRKDGLSSDLVDRIKTEMKKILHPDLQPQADEIFEIRHDRFGKQA